ncbi:MAG: PilZ domain-containing protein [Rhizomicrobium sp.]
MHSSMEVVPQVPPQRAHEARAPRHRTYLNGKLVYGEGIFAPDGAFSLDCAIRDMSEGGARVTLSKRQPLPSDLFLIVVKYCVAYRAKVVWMEFPARGLKFSTTYPLSADLPDDLKFLRRLWGELYVRLGGVER